MALNRPNVTKPAESEAEVLTTQGVEAAVAQVVPTTVEYTAQPAQAPAVETVAQAAPAVAEASEPAQVAAQATSFDPTEVVSTTTEVAARQEGPTSIAVQRENALQKFAEEQAAAGFEGLELSGMSFDRIKLNEGKFLLGSDETDLGTEINCVIHNTRKIYVVRQGDFNDAKAYYSYDPQGKTLTDGSSAEEILQEWLEDGYGTAESPLDIKEYLEAMATLVGRDDEYDGTMVMLSIPPASKPRLAGAAAQAYTRFKGARLDQVITKCAVGKKIGEGQKAFRPWVFSVVGRYEG